MTRLSSAYANLSGRFRSLGGLLKQARSPVEAAKLGAALACAQLAPTVALRALPLEIRAGFHAGDVRFRLGQGELTPYMQIVEDLRMRWVPRQEERRDWVILDGGANIGLFGILFQPVRRVIAVEPNPDCYARLLRNLGTNGINSTTYRAALSSSEGEIRFAIPKGSTVLAKVDDEGGVPVRAMTIDGVMDEAGVAILNLLKLDVEGHELEALAGARNALSSGRIERLFIEFTSGEGLRALDACLAEHRYRRVETADFNAVYFSPAVPAPPQEFPRRVVTGV